eukprot:TRINITY_DN10134_c0_g1_i1.p2 TRINITY_DN10134_c0_g1~~TRINITY_DN10134_c0_g1_i1.p2  ORF type:complete len:213 (+),score=96.66 TRINITY_DN10134_c0_g1_i1:144-782(+)
MSVSLDSQWMVAISTQDLIKSMGANKVEVASFYGHMQGRRMTREIFADVLAALEDNTTLKVLDLDHNEVGRWEDGLPRLMVALRPVVSLTKLNLNSCQIDDAGVDVLCGFFAENRTVEDLWLYGNNVTVRGAIALHRMLVTANAALKIINLRNNNISPVAQRLLVYEPLETERPRPLSLKEQVRLHVIAKRVQYKAGVFPCVCDDFLELLDL